MTKRELDCWVAVHIEGLQIEECAGGWFLKDDYLRVPSYTEDISASMPIALRYHLAIIPAYGGFIAGRFDTLARVEIAATRGYVVHGLLDGVLAPTPAMAICLALKQIVEDRDEDR